MKTWLISVIALGSFAAAPVFANDVADMGVQSQSAKIREFRIDSGLQAGNVVGGDIAVDRKAGTVELTLYRKVSCPEGRICIQMELVPEPFRVTLPITGESDAGCGNREIIASQDLRPTDGDLEEIRVVDRSGETCEIARLHATDVYFDTTSLRGLQTHSYFGADALQADQTAE